MKTKMYFLITVFIAQFFGYSCNKTADKFVEPAAKTGFVSGKITDASGKGLPNIKVVMEHTLWHATYVYGHTKADGSYKMEVPSDPAGPWTIKAQNTFKAWGQEYLVDFFVENSESFTAKDAPIRNMTWKLTGKHSSGYYYGAHIDLFQWDTDLDFSKLKLLLTPIDPNLIDDSKAKPIEGKIENVAGTFMMKDIPIGHYKVKAIYPGKTITLKNKTLPDEPTLEKEFIFGKYGYLGDNEYNIEFWLGE